MINILVVDDFTADREDLVAALESFDGLDIGVVGAYESGEAALEALPQLRPDIVVSDVEMPFMDGITFAALAREKLPNVRFIFCSLYDRFTYVQNAFRVGSDGYVLKPVDRAELRAVLAQTIENLVDHRRLREEYARLADFVEQNRAPLVETLLADLIFGKTTREDALEKGAALGFALEGRSFGLAVVEIDDFHQTTARLGTGNGALLSLMAGRELDRCLEQVPEATAVRLDDAHYAVVLAFTGPAPAGAARMLVGLGEKLLAQLAGDEISATIALADAAEDFMALGARYTQCTGLLEYKVLLGKGRIITPAESPVPVHAVPMDIGALQKQVRFLLNTGADEEIDRFVAELFAGAAATGAGGPRTLAYSLAVCVQLVLAEAGDAMAGVAETNGGVWAQLDRFETVEDAVRLFRRLMHTCASRLKRRRSSDRAAFIARVQGYIQQADYRELGIEAIAAHFFYSANYLNHVFKEETGQTILEYLTVCRVERAKQLLRRPGGRIGDIAATLGYSHATYFNHVFKKHVGVSAREYRSYLENTANEG